MCTRCQSVQKAKRRHGPRRVQWLGTHAYGVMWVHCVHGQRIGWLDKAYVWLLNSPQPCTLAAIHMHAHMHLPVSHMWLYSLELHSLLGRGPDDAMHQTPRPTLQDFITVCIFRKLHTVVWNDTTPADPSNLTWTGHGSPTRGAPGAVIMALIGPTVYQGHHCAAASSVAVMQNCLE